MPHQVYTEIKELLESKYPTARLNIEFEIDPIAEGSTLEIGLATMNGAVWDFLQAAKERGIAAVDIGSGNPYDIRQRVALVRETLDSPPLVKATLIAQKTPTKNVYLTPFTMGKLKPLSVFGKTDYRVAYHSFRIEDSVFDFYLASWDSVGEEVMFLQEFADGSMKLDIIPAETSAQYKLFENLVWVPGFMKIELTERLPVTKLDTERLCYDEERGIYMHLRRDGVDTYCYYHDFLGAPHWASVREDFIRQIIRDGESEIVSTAFIYR